MLKSVGGWGASLRRDSGHKGSQILHSGLLWPALPAPEFLPSC